MLERNRVNTPEKQSSDDIDIGRFIGELIDHRWLVIGVTAACLTIAIIYAIFSTPIYSADALVQVEQKSANSILGDINKILPDSQPESAPEIELIQSRMVLGKTVEDMNLTTAVEQDYFPIFGRGYNRLIGNKPGVVTVSQFTLPEEWEKQVITLVVGDGQTYSVVKDDKTLFKGKVGEPSNKDGVSIFITSLEAKPGTTFTVSHRSMQKAMNSLLASLSVTDRGKNTGVLELDLTGEDPVKISEILNSIIGNYLQQNIARKSEEDAKSLAFLQTQLPATRSELDAAENKLNQFRQKNDSVDLPLEAKSVLDSLVSADTQLNELTFKEADISKLYTKEHPAYRALLEKRKTLEDEKERLNKKVNLMPKTQQEIVRLSRDVQSGQEVYMQLLNRQQELQISKASTVGYVRIVDPAVTQEKPVKPRKMVVLALGILIGLFLSGGYVLLKAFLLRRIESPEQLEEYGINVYASIPLSEWQRKKDRELLARNKRQKIKSSNTNADNLLVIGNPADLAIEAIRSLRTSLHFAMMEAKNNILMITGASPGIGKTFVSANLAGVVAQAGIKVLFIDSDMRKGYAHELIGVAGTEGLSDILSGKLSAASAVKQTPIANFDFISRGKVPPNPSELLMHARFNEVLKWASENYDLVLVDTPPILAVTDAAIIGKNAGTTLMVARFGVNTPKEVDVSIRRLEQNGIDVKGVIINAIVKKTSGYYTYGYNSYDYSYK
ncbi:Tyrosine-protein kinase wzc [Serratia entomophila]|uniref:Tyrosine-protein kinase Wzc n=1 Tax=Serratia entomophila TaxID=42906 RepID=A0ABY5CY76_9GAMM|nr:tyrosine-protein kinase Wzc [Serratia entomophila]UIW19886.1 tyrosine-protein kinase Wzc [Serratia entomophila]USV02406.1 tyrosine-protein kinase Wzc [Serratia entomophila]CAI0761139.1 Tyrosine-protein kinase wzc [Serratia entomophila]CAI0771113.1 Tyrosine-protein kinase wzc [Serratia entomophila]CAI0774888.1 Tyrosine-protein kinase wzc [Serratia entomophila]